MLSIDSEKLYVLVEDRKDKGFWEVNMKQKKAYFRGKTDALEPGIVIEDKRGECKDIFQYLSNKAKYVKELIPGSKIIFSDNMFCSYYVSGLDKHHPTTVWHCDNIATLKKDGRPYCKNHI